MNKKQVYVLLKMFSPLLFIVVLFLAVPGVYIVFDSFSSSNGFTFENYIVALTNAFYVQAIFNSIKISALSSIIAIVAALICAYSLYNSSGKLQKKIISFLNVTSNFSGVPLALGYILLLGNTGALTLLFERLNVLPTGVFDLYSWFGITIVYVYFQIPLAIMLLFPAFSSIKKDFIESSQLLGASTLYFYKRVGIPILLPSIIGTISVLFANAMGAYATAYALVGSNYNLLSIRIASLVMGEVFPKPELSGALAVILGFVSIGTMLLNEKIATLIKKGQ